MQILIVRDQTLSGAEGTFGIMFVDGKQFCATCEQPWNNNLPNAFCIPVGNYQLIPYDSPAHGATVVFHNPSLSIFGTPAMIPSGKQGRSLCEIHNANWPFQLRGCVAVGSRVVDIPPHGLGVNNSVKTLAELMLRWGKREGLTATVQ